jgi:hypothetical protein
MSYFVLCDTVEPGLIPGEVTAGVRNFQSKLEFVRAPEDGVIEEGGKQYLGVGVVRYDEKSGAYLVTFPSEADSGTNRAWVRGRANASKFP